MMERIQEKVAKVNKEKTSHYIYFRRLPGGKPKDKNKANVLSFKTKIQGSVPEIKKKKDLKSTMYLRKSVDNNQHKVCSYKITGF